MTDRAPCRKSVWRTAAIAIVVLLLTAHTAGFEPVAKAESCVRSLPQDVKDARGHTFVGTVTALLRRDKLDYVRLDVGKVFAGTNEPPDGPLGVVLRSDSPIELYSPNCDGIRNLRVGQRYLVSTWFLHISPASLTAIWALDGDSAALVRMFPGAPFDERLANATTLQDAIDLMVPGQPPTDSIAMRHDDQAGSFAPLILGGTLALCAWFALRLRSRRADPN